MKIKISIILVIILLYSCAGPSIKRIGYEISTEIKPDTCHIKITRNDNTLDINKRIGTIILYDNGASFNCSESDVLRIIKKEACQIGATLANLYNIQNPSFWGSSCFQTYADFYIDDKSDSGKIKKQQLTIIDSSKNAFKKKFDTIKNVGNEISIDLMLGLLLSGNQKEIGNGLKPKPDRIESFGIGLRYSHWWDIVGLDAGFTYMSSSAEKSNYKSFGLFHQYIFYSGIGISPIIIYSSNSTTRIFMRCGFNYDILTLSDDFLDLLKTIPEISQEAVTKLSDEQAKGLGYYISVGFDRLFRSYIIGLNITYEEYNPKFSDAVSKINGNYLNFKVCLGYKF